MHGIPVAALVIRLLLVLQQQSFRLELSEDIMLSNTHDCSAEHVMARYRSEVYRFEIVLMIIRHQQIIVLRSFPQSIVLVRPSSDS